jgi:predicted outer membrane repeat protein
MRGTGYWWHALVLLGLLVGLAAVQPARVRAATDTVTTCNETTLRSVISSAAPGDTVNFSCSGTITLTAAGGGAITLSENLIIDGTGQTVTISGGGSVQVFMVNSGVTVTLNDLTIANGNAGFGGGIDNEGTLTVTNSTFSGNNSSGFGGGGIANNGTLSVSNSTFSANSTSDIGGAILNYGGIFGSSVTVTNSTFSGNNATFSGGAIASQGGTVGVSNSTLSGNSALNGVGGGISNFGQLSVTNVTLSGNTAVDGGAIANNFGGTASLANTIVARSQSGGNCGSGVTDAGGNVDDGITCGFGAGSLSNTNPHLGPLANNGGPTQTMALLAGSPAIDFTSCLQTTDQRGFPRSDNGEAKCDSGAYEFQDAGPPATLTLTPPSQTLTVNAQACLQAAVTDRLGTAVPNSPVLFTVGGANRAGGSVNTDASGQATFCYTGLLAGADTVTATADPHHTGQPQPGEPRSTATVTWTLPASTSWCSVLMRGTITASDGDSAKFAGLGTLQATGAPRGFIAYSEGGPAQRLSLKAPVQALVCNSVHTQADLYGTTPINGSGSYAYRVEVIVGPTGAAMYSLLLSSGYSSGAQVVRNGAVRITTRLS